MHASAAFLTLIGIGHKLQIDPERNTVTCFVQKRDLNDGHLRERRTFYQESRPANFQKNIVISIKKLVLVFSLYREHKATFGTKYSRMDQINLRKTAFKDFYLVHF